VRLRIAATLLLTAACLGWVVHGLDLGVARATLRTMHVRWLIEAEVLYLAVHVIRVHRSRVLLGRALPLGRLFSLTNVGYLALHVVPFRLGEVVRPWLFHAREGVPLREGLAMVLAERLLDTLALLTMLLAVGGFVTLPRGVVVEGVDVLRVGQRAAGLVVALGMVGLLTVVVGGARLDARLAGIPGAARLRPLLAALRGMAADPVRGARALALTAGIWTLTVLAVQRTLAGFPGLPHTAVDALVTWALTLAGMTALPTPGFFGGYEAVGGAVVELLGGERSVARTFALLMHLSQFGFTVVLGLVALGWEGLRLGDVITRSRSAVGAPDVAVARDS
jgi:uncharacterized membrane protein YbhN (UPF0104 family)